MDNLKSHFDLNFYKIQGKKSINTFNNFIIQTNRETDHRIRVSLYALKLLSVLSILGHDSIHRGSKFGDDLSTSSSLTDKRGNR